MEILISAALASENPNDERANAESPDDEDKFINA